MGGDLFFPSPPPACRTILHAGGKLNAAKGKNTGGRKRTRSGGGGAAGRTTSLVVLRWRPVAVSWLTDGGSKRCYCFKRRRKRLLLFLSPLCASLFFRFRFGFTNGSLSRSVLSFSFRFALLCFRLVLSLSLWFISVFFLLLFAFFSLVLSPLSVSSSVPLSSLFLPPLRAACSVSIYRG